jgi:hypothetical protein
MTEGHDQDKENSNVDPTLKVTPPQVDPDKVEHPPEPVEIVQVAVTDINSEKKSSNTSADEASKDPAEIRELEEKVIEKKQRRRYLRRSAASLSKTPGTIRRDRSID